MLLGRLTHGKKAEDKTTSSYIKTPSSPGRLRRLVTFLILIIVIQAVIHTTIAFVPLFLVDHFGIGEEAAAASMAIIYSAGLWAGPLGGYLSDRWGRVPVILAVFFVAGPVIYLLNMAPYAWGISAVLVVIGVIMYFRMAVSEAYIVSHTPERNRSTVLGIYYFGSMEGSGVLTPLIGYLFDQIGLYATLNILGATMLAVTVACAIFLWGSRD